MENDFIVALSMALERDEYRVYYQPKASCQSGVITSFEALLRWQRPDHGLVPPIEFIPSLESTGLIEQVGTWVLRTACRQLRDWDKLGFDRLSMAVNVSLRQLVDPAFVGVVCSVLTEYEISPERLELELTESMLMHDVEQTETLLFQLKAKGVRLSIDDFGTGYSCLAYLRRLPIDTVKIDRTFVNGITTNPNDASITRAIVSMAHSLKMSVVAEGVETEAQLSTLIAGKCETVQGYFIGKPMPADAALLMLKSDWSLPSALLSRPNKVKTLLLVDDEASIVSALKRLLRREEYQILGASSGAQGLEMLALHDVDVIVSDQRMPGMTGEEFLRRAKDLYPETIRLVLSGYADMESITSAINQGAIYKFLSKPWDDTLLKETIREAFHRKELGDENQRLTREIEAMNIDLHRSNEALAKLLKEQTHQSQFSLAALLAAQETLHLLPVPVVGLDPDGQTVFRNAAFEALEGSADVCGGLAEHLPPFPSLGVQSFLHSDASGHSWRLMGRHLANEKGHRGMVFAFFPSGDGHE
jgi:EAL domain-containing protein (putative c-di-GMP-specific phosphodiesterase class I)/FixJ family two-component response regulator